MPRTYTLDPFLLATCLATYSYFTLPNLGNDHPKQNKRSENEALLPYSQSYQHVRPIITIHVPLGSQAPLRNATGTPDGSQRAVLP